MCDGITSFNGIHVVPMRTFSSVQYYIRNDRSAKTELLGLDSITTTIHSASQIQGESPAVPQTLCYPLRCRNWAKR